MRFKCKLLAFKRRHYIASRDSDNRSPDIQFNNAGVHPITTIGFLMYYKNLSII